MLPQYFIGAANVKVANLDADGNPGAFVDMGESPSVEWNATVEYADAFSTGKAGPNLQNLHVPIKRSATLAIMAAEKLITNLERFFHGSKSTDTASSVSGAEFPAGIEAGQTYLLPGRHVDVSSVVIVDSAGSPSTLTPGSHYTVDEDAGLVTFLDVDAAAAVAATATVHFASQPNADDTTVVGGKTYTWKVSPTLSTHIEIGDDIETSATNLMQKINTDTATTLCTATADPNDVFLTANTPGVAGNSITLTTDGARLTDTNFSGGDDADALVQPFKASYSYAESTVLRILSETPGEVAVMVEGQNLAVPGERFRAIFDRISFAPAAKIALKSGSTGGTGNSPDTYELTGSALLGEGKTAADGYGEYRVF